MQRLLQGDVGSGKTIVAAIGCLAAIDAGCQAAVMAPTEILAEQHHRLFTRLLAGQGCPVALLTAPSAGAIAAACGFAATGAAVVAGSGAAAPVVSNAISSAPTATGSSSS